MDRLLAVPQDDHASTRNDPAWQRKQIRRGSNFHMATRIFKNESKENQTYRGRQQTMLKSSLTINPMIKYNKFEINIQ